MEFRQLEAFAAIAKYKSFSKAANALYLTQPTISAHLGSLERERQKKLVSRTTKTIQLTQDGEKFLKYVNRILELKEAAVQELAGEEKEIISLGASTIPSGYLLPGLLSEFRRQHPGVFFQIRQGDSCEIEEKVTDGTVELGLVGSSCDLPECICTKFCSDSMVIAMPCTSYYMNLKRQAEKTGDIRMFFSEPFIMREIGSGTRKAAGEFLEKMGIREENLNVAARINDIESIKRMIAMGMGISMMSGYAVEDMVNSGQLITYPLDTQIHRKFYLLYRKKREKKPVVDSFIRFVMDFYKDAGNER